ncbi:VCP-like ATPase [Candidatus Methanoperedenaceae archaeon GB50]|nr:VCP-like ATPase [Candidatus Methanoperedenaceae archaeon GB50]CAD7775622.1 MAG: VCP-like ATPase [Candidatus Methanoperedenaceae archaeon GB50]
MPNEFREIVKEKVKEIQQEVYIKDEILEKIVGLFLSLRDGRFPSKKPPRGLLFYGPPGTGKTLLMKTLAKKLGTSEPIMIKGPEIISQYYGKSEAKLRQIFTLAKERAEEENLAIIFIDELDSLAPRRDITKGELEPRLVGQLLSLMDGLEREVSKGHVIVIGSTNRPEVLDPALRRPGRFDLEIEFDPPSADERKEILKILLNNYASGHYANINLDEIAEQTIGFTGADLLQLLNESLLQAAFEGRDFITQEDLLNAKNNVKPSALREFNIEKPKDRSAEIEDREIVDKIWQIAEDFSRNPHFKPILLSKPLPLADKIASTIAYIVCQRLHCPYVVVRGTWFRTRWFGETERSIRELFGKINRLQPCVVYIKNIDAIARSEDEHLYGAILELLDSLTNLSDNNVEVLLLGSAKDEDKLDREIRSYFKGVI